MTRSSERSRVIPSILSTQVRRGLEEFLLTSFLVTTPLFQ